MVLNKNTSHSYLKLQRLVLTCHSCFSLFLHFVSFTFSDKKNVTMEICLSRLVNVLLLAFYNLLVIYKCLSIQIRGSVYWSRDQTMN